MNQGRGIYPRSFPFSSEIGGTLGFGWFGKRNVALMLVLVLFASLLTAVSLVTSSTPAAATSNPDGTAALGDNTFYAYVGSGESLAVDFTKFLGVGTNGVSGSTTRFVVTDSSDTIQYDCTVLSTAAVGSQCQSATLTGAVGVWTIEMIPSGSRPSNWPESSFSLFVWDIIVASGVNSDISGRVWTEKYRGYDATVTAPSGQRDLNLWVVSENGAVYTIDIDNFNGGGWALDSNAFGIVFPGTCTSLYHSTLQETNTPEYSSAPASCGDSYKLFFENPDTDLPISAPSASGTDWILPDVKTPTITDMAFIEAGDASKAGKIQYTLNDFTGTYHLLLDGDNDGNFSGANDRTISLGGTSGTQSYTWDGLDGQGNQVASCATVNARVQIDRTDEVHFVLGDAEGLNGMEILQQRGNSPGNSTIFWDDTQISTTGKTSITPILDGTGGYDSTGGVHGWSTSDVNPWGNQVAVDNWTYSQVDIAQTLAIEGNCLSVEKTSDATEDSRPGDTITYSVKVTNLGDADYTVEDPAIFSDDLTGVVDDADYNNDASTDLPGNLTYTSPVFRWEGALASHETVELTYTVTLKAGGDRTVRNVAWSGGGETPDCDPPNSEGNDPDTGDPCSEVEFELPYLEVTKVSDVTDLPVDGGVVEYSVTISNPSNVDYTDAAPATFSDDLSDVLDDGDYNHDASASIGTVLFDAAGEKLDWSWALVSGDSVIITYSVTYDSVKAGGNHLLVNTVCVPIGEAQNPDLACDSVQIPAAALQEEKTVDPVTGTAVVVDQELTYTLYFRSVGETAATVNTADDLSEALDDAELTSGPTSSNAGLVVGPITDGIFAITGSVPAGEEYTVTYTLKVKSYDEQGDHLLVNVLQCDANTPLCDPLNPPTTENPVRHASIAKSSNAQNSVNTGDTVTYTVTVTNDGAADYSAQEPASAIDDLTGVLDDATYNADASATVGSVSYDAPILTWSGQLAAGTSASFSYTVTVTNAGDHELENVAQVVCPTDQPCELPVTVGTLLPHVIQTKVSDPVSGVGVAAGQTVTYTLSYTNDGKSTGTVDSTDDLTDVLDDANLTGLPVTSNPAVTATVSGSNIRIVGEIEAGKTVTVIYKVIVKQDGKRGNNTANNILIPDVPGCEHEVSACPLLAVKHPIGELDDWKSVDPASGSTVQPGKVVTYTLYFENIGKAEVSVNREDNLMNVLDDAQITSAPKASDGALSVTEVKNGTFQIAGTLAKGQLVTVSYQVKVNPDGERGDDQLGNFLVDPGGQPATTCAPKDAIRADCTVNPVSNITVVKSSDPETGEDVESGQTIQYTLTFANVSTNAQAAPVAVDYIDHMAGVLDDAVLTVSPETSDPALSVSKLVDDKLSITGQLVSGQVVTVTYSVKVKAYDEQEDHILTNFVTDADGEVASSCIEESKLCTDHAVLAAEATPGIAETGFEIGVSIAFGILLIGGGIFMILGRRRGDRLESMMS